MTTVETITDDQIRALRDEACAHGDFEQRDLCDRALCRDDETIDQDGNAIAYADWTQDEAREACARTIDYAAAESAADHPSR